MRKQHYLFAHRALPQVAFANPEREVALLHSPDAPRLIRALWDQVCTHCPEPTDLYADQIRVHVGRAGPFPCAIIEMPPPLYTAEAHFTALVLRKFKQQDAVTTLSPALLYYTLEKGMAGDGGERTVFCSWTENGTHSNYGDGPAPTLQAFSEVVSERALATIKDLVPPPTPSQSAPPPPASAQKWWQFWK